MGLLLFGTENVKAAADQQAFPGTFVLQEPDTPSASSMRELQQLIDAKDVTLLARAFLVHFSYSPSL